VYELDDKRLDLLGQPFAATVNELETEPTQCRIERCPSHRRQRTGKLRLAEPYGERLQPHLLQQTAHRHDAPVAHHVLDIYEGRFHISRQIISSSAAAALRPPRHAPLFRKDRDFRPKDGYLNMAVRQVIAIFAAAE